MSSAVRSGTQFGEFLRSRRARVTPEEAGLLRGGGLRRTPGLRREELATLAGISIDYYIRLERGTERHPSPAVIDALSRALQLDADEVDHLRELVSRVDRTDRVERVASSRRVPAGTRLLLEQLRPFPAYVSNRIGDLLAWNPAGIRMLPGIQDWPATKRNIARFAFLHPAARELYANRKAQLAGLVSGLRQLAAIEPDATDLQDLVGELTVKSQEFAHLWERYDIDRYRHGSKHLHHPMVGELTAAYQVMHLEGSDGQTLLSYHARPGTPEHDAFVLLDSLEDTALNPPQDASTPTIL